MKKNILISLLLAIGLILSQITPPFLGGMRFDFLLSFMFISLILTKDFKSALLTGTLSGILSAMVTTFPGGQIPNILEKILVSIYIFSLLKFFKYNLSKIRLVFLSLSGTFISGGLFLIFANFFVGLPASLYSLIIAVVIPATILNSIGTVFLFNLVKRAIALSNFNINNN